MDFPAACPLFQVNYPTANRIKHGAIVEGMGEDLEVDGKRYDAPRGFVIVRAIDDADIIDEPSYVYKCFRTVGWFGCPHGIDDLKPLTPAAEEMLAIARARQ